MKLAEEYICSDKLTSKILHFCPFSLNNGHPFFNLLRCKDCGYSIVGDFAKKKYIYYRCSFSKGQHPHEKYIREHQLDEAFAALIDAISLKPGVVARGYKKP